MNRRTTSIAGFTMCVIAAFLMVTEVLDTGWGATLGMVGIGLIAAAAGSSTD